MIIENMYIMGDFISGFLLYLQLHNAINDYLYVKKFFIMIEKGPEEIIRPYGYPGGIR